MNAAIDIVPLWLFFPLAAAMGMLAVEGGYQFGMWRHEHVTQENDSTVAAISASVLGLLGIMLAFTFSLAASRFEARRQGVLEESNAIGTTYLRARLLPEPERAEVAALLREYTEIRVPGAEGLSTAELIARSEAMHERLWQRALVVAEKTPSSIMTGLFVQSLNELIDDHSKRVAVGLRGRLPGSIWLALFGLAVLGLSSLGYQAGLSATRRSPAMLVMTFAFAVVL